MIDINKLKKQVLLQYNTDFLHMPYIYYVNNKPVLLFDIKINNYWKIFKYNNDTIIKIDTPTKDFNNNTNQCNPFIIKNNNKWLFQYTSNFVLENEFINHGYNSTLNIVLKQQIYQLKNKNVYYKDQNTEISLIYCDKNFYINNVLYEINNMYAIMCIRPIFNTNKLLFSLIPRNKNQQHKACSLIYDRDTDIFKYIHLINKDINSIYKCSIDPFNGDLYYAKYNGIFFEDRTIQAITKDQYELLDTNIILRA